SKSNFLFEHDLFRKPVPTLRDHALTGKRRQTAPLTLLPGFQRYQPIKIDRLIRNGVDRLRSIEGAGPINQRPRIFIISVTIAPTFANDSMSATMNFTPNSSSTATMKLM